MAEAAAEIHQLKSANESLSKQLKEAQDEVKVLTVLNQRGDAELNRLQLAVSSSKDAAVRQGANHTVLQCTCQNPLCAGNTRNSRRA